MLLLAIVLSLPTADKIVSGTVEKFTADSGELTIKTTATTVSVIVTEDSDVFVDGKPADPSKIKAGLSGSAIYDPDTSEATKIRLSTKTRLAKREQESKRRQKKADERRQEKESIEAEKKASKELEERRQMIINAIRNGSIVGKELPINPEQPILSDYFAAEELREAHAAGTDEVRDTLEELFDKNRVLISKSGLVLRVTQHYEYQKTLDPELPRSFKCRIVKSTNERAVGKEVWVLDYTLLP